MRINLITGIDQNTLGGVLLYHLKKEGVSIDAQLLVIWGHNSNGLYSDAWLIDNEGAFVWNEDKLKRLCDAYTTQDDIYYDVEGFSLNNNINLEIVCKSMYGFFEIEVAVYEFESLPCSIKPLYIDPSRWVPTESMMPCTDLYQFYSLPRALSAYL
jgi:hypothetical protein